MKRPWRSGIWSASPWLPIWSAETTKVPDLGPRPPRVSPPWRCSASRSVRLLAGVRPAEQGRACPRGRLARPGQAAARRGRSGLRGAGVPAHSDRTAASGVRRCPSRMRRIRAGRRDRQPVRRTGSHDPGTVGPRSGVDPAGPGARGRRTARRGHGCGHGWRGVSGHRRDGLLRRDRSMPGDLRSSSGAGMDRSPERLVRFSTGPRAIPRSVSGASSRGVAAARGVARRRERGDAGV